jgi:hypothetical protein
MKLDKTAENIRYNVQHAMICIERAACCEPLDDSTIEDIMADARMLATDATFRAEYDAKRGAGPMWLAAMIRDARQPYPHDAPIVERELWRHLREARERSTK